VARPVTPVAAPPAPTAPEGPPSWLNSNRQTWNSLNGRNAVINQAAADLNAKIDKLESTAYGTSVPGKAQIAGYRKEITALTEERAWNLKALKSLKEMLDKFNTDNKTSYRYAAGGFVSGPGTPTSDSIPAMLSNGE
jgi:hypothetical protein